MVTRSHRNPRRTDKGFATVEILVIVGFSFLLLVFLTNIIAIQYGRGIVRAAADEGARAGARVSANPVAACMDRQHNVVSGVGKMMPVFTSQCQVVPGVLAGGQWQAGRIIATNHAEFPLWLLFDETISMDVTATATKEEAPPA